MADLTELLPRLAMTIGGEPIATTETFPVVNPSSGEVFAHAPRATAAHIDAVMDAADKAFAEWRLDDDARRAALADAAVKVTEALEDIALLMAHEQGKLLDFARFEVKYSSVAWLHYYAALELAPEILQDDKRGYTELVRDPLGVVAAITPWNFPIALAMWKIAPALRAGNTVVLKPSPYTPLSSLRLVQAMNEALPPGVLNIVTATDDLAPYLTGHPVPRKLSFTGSVETGKKIGAAAVGGLKRMTLELGGNDAAIVLEDADIQAVADEIFWGAFTNSGQICVAIKRVYAPESKYDELVQALADRAAAVVVGDPLDPASTMGPISNEAQLRRVTELVEDAVQAGAKVAAGGHRLDRPGFFFEPTILRASDGMRVVDEEQFGPVLPVIAYTDVDDAVRRANGTDFGLTATVWTSDAERGEAVARRLDAGKVAVNSHMGGMGPQFPFGGHKSSGLGVENGPWGLHGFTDIKVVHRKKTP